MFLPTYARSEKRRTRQSGMPCSETWLHGSAENIKGNACLIPTMHWNISRQRKKEKERKLCIRTFEERERKKTIMH